MDVNMQNEKTEQEESKTGASADWNFKWAATSKGGGFDVSIAQTNGNGLSLNLGLAFVAGYVESLNTAGFMQSAAGKVSDFGAAHTQADAQLTDAIANQISTGISKLKVYAKDNSNVGSETLIAALSVH